MNKKERAQRMAGIKDWCKDMMKKYLLYWSADDEIHKKLKQFHDEGVMKGIIYKSTSQRKKEQVLSSIAQEINQMYNDLN